MKKPVHLVHYPLLPYHPPEADQLIENRTGHRLGTGTLVNISPGCSTNLSGFVEEVKDNLQQSPVINNDETGYYLEGGRQRLHAAATEQYTFYYAPEKRGCEAMDAMGVLADYKGIVMHDYWKGCLDNRCIRAFCSVHHLGNLTCGIVTFFN